MEISGADIAENIIIREVSEDDAKQILNLVLEMAEESDNFPFTSKDYSMSIENQRSFINYMQYMKNSIFYAAFDQSNPVGIIYLEGGKRIRTFHNCSLGMGVKKEYWNKKIGTKLLEKSLEFVLSNENIAKINLEVRTDNIYAIKLYKRYGFEIEGKIKRALFIDGKFYDYLSMGILID